MGCTIQKLQPKLNYKQTPGSELHGMPIKKNSVNKLSWKYANILDINYYMCVKLSTKRNLNKKAS